MSQISESIKNTLGKVTSMLQLDSLIPYDFGVYGAWLLLIHLVLFSLENWAWIGTIPNLFQSIFETRRWIQEQVITSLVKYGSLLMGFWAGNQGSFYDINIAIIKAAMVVLAVVLLVNKFTLVMTSQCNADFLIYNSDFPTYLMPTGFTNQSTVCQTPGSNSTGSSPVLSMTRVKFIYILFSWLQAVTNILLQQVPSNIIYGFAIGKALAALTVS